MGEKTKDELTFTFGQDRGWWVKLWHKNRNIAFVIGDSLDEAKTNAKEIIRRWNAFEEGGITSDLLKACEAMKKVWWMVGNRITLAGTLPTQIEQIGKQAEAALAKAKA